MGHLNVTMSKYDCHVTLYGHVGVFSTKNVKVDWDKSSKGKAKKIKSMLYANLFKIIHLS